MKNTFNICTLGNADPYRAWKRNNGRQSSYKSRLQSITFTLPELIKYGVPPFKGVAIEIQ